MFRRLAISTAISAILLCASGDDPVVTSPPSPALELRADPSDPGVLRAQDDLEKIRKLVAHGGLPYMRLERAREELQDAEDLAILRAHLYGKDLLPEQAEQLVSVSQRMVVRRQKSLTRMRQLVESGVISRAEAEASGADFDRAQTEMQLAVTRSQLVQQMAESLRLERSIAAVEVQVESHPEWIGKLYTRFDGRSGFNPSELQSISAAFVARFARPLPISADGATAVHKSLGFDHRGRVDVAVNPDLAEGAWLMKFLENRGIPYFAFRMAIPGMATGAHIHIGPGSTKYIGSD